MELYAMVHEVVALTDFGRLRPCPWLVAAQRPDGSWGPCSTSRANKERHAVLTSLAALWAYRDEL